MNGNKELNIEWLDARIALVSLVTYVSDLQLHENV